jgi:hypothetical protein
VAHAEILALKQKYGLSYKDAAHRLYHSEVQKLNAEDEAYAMISELRRQVDDIVEKDVKNMIMDIDRRVSDGAEDNQK